MDDDGNGVLDTGEIEQTLGSAAINVLLLATAGAFIGQDAVSSVVVNSKRSESGKTSMR